MPLPFKYICDLLEQLDRERHSTGKQTNPGKRLIEDWFREHRLRLDAPTVNGCAILSTLLPERRTDRVYGIQVNRLESIIGSALILGQSRVKILRKHRTPGLGVDLGDCVESLLTDAPNSTRPEDVVTVEEIDDALHRIAASCRFSSPKVRASRGSGDQRSNNQELANFYVRLGARDAKWLTRLVLKNYRPVFLDERTVFQAFHPLLPQMLKVRDDLNTAVPLIRQVNRSAEDENYIAKVLKPVLGTKVGRQPWFKGRSIKHCVDMIEGRQISCEHKIDGEYCQIHIDLSRSANPIQIFSKSGKDSTQDRKGLHHTIRDSLQLGRRGCPIKQGCIIEGELVVYSDKEQKILPFHKIRKHVSRSGAFIGTHLTSQPHDYEHLMIVYYDCLMIDNASLLGKRQSERFRQLERLITCRKGHAELVTRHLISFTRQDSAASLREIFAKCIMARGEGLVLKPDVPYFHFGTHSNPYTCSVIKLKKEYLKGFGDVGDFAVIGASYDAAKAKLYNIPSLKWTDFFIGCLQNPQSARARVEKPRFVVTNVVDLPAALMRTFRAHCNPVSVPLDEIKAFELDFRGMGQEPKSIEVFPDPIIFDMRCFSFDKEANSRTWSMRFPIVSKIHFDRSYLDTISFEELQEAARAATEAPEQEDSQEMRRWVRALEKADPRGIAVDAVTQSTISNVSSSLELERPRSRKSNIGDTISAAGVDSSIPARGTENDPIPLMTPPRSSALQGPREEEHMTAGTNLCGGQKRVNDHESGNTCQKRQRHSGSFVDLGVLSARSSFEGSNTSLTRSRQPLGMIDGNGSPLDRRSQAQPAQSVPSTQTCVTAFTTLAEPNQANLLPNGSFRTADGLPSSPPLPLPAQADEVASEPTSKSMAPASESCYCAHASERCALANSVFLLSPCISSYAFVEDLLNVHGIRNFTVDPKDWAREPDRTLSLCHTSGAHREGSSLGAAKMGRARKLCLIESKRPAATHQFMKRIEAAGLQRRNGQREWISVYDWRILEDITKLESGAPVTRAMDPWRQHYVGIA